jgi:hypothetical protein
MKNEEQHIVENDEDDEEFDPSNPLKSNASQDYIREKLEQHIIEIEKKENLISPQKNVVETTH